MFKFLKDIKELKRDVAEIFDEFNKDRVQCGWFSSRRTLAKRVSDLEVIVDKLMGHLKVEANEVAAIPEQITVIKEVPATWEIKPAGTNAKKSKAKFVNIKKTKKTKKGNK